MASSPPGAVAAPKPVMFSLRPGGPALASTSSSSSGGGSGSPGLMSLGGVKKPSPLVKKSVVLHEGDDEGGEGEGATELIVGIDASGAKTLSDAPKKALVIPLIETNVWRNSPSVSSASTPAPPAQEQHSPAAPARSEEDEALAALKAEATGDDGFLGPTVKVLPLLARNQPPGIESLSSEEAKFKYDLQMRPEESTLADYAAVPVEDFGQALLRGMGWEEGKGIGKGNTGLLAPIEYVPRQDRLGLGAQPKPMDETDQNGKRRRIPKPGETTTPKPTMVAAPTEDGRVRHFKSIDEKLVVTPTTGRNKTNNKKQPFEKKNTFLVDIRVGSPVSLVGGRHEGLRGVVREGDDKSSSLVVRLDKGGQDVTVRRSDVLHSSLAPPSRKSDSSSTSSRPASRQDNSSSSSKKRPLTWLVPGLRVRVVSEKWKDGKHYNRKVVVVDIVFDADGSKRSSGGSGGTVATLRTDEGLVLNGKFLCFCFRVF